MGSQSATRHQRRIEKIERTKRITGKSLGCIRPDNSVRVALHKLQASDTFEWTINILILINCIFLAFNGPHVKEGSDLEIALFAVDIIFTVIFFLEMCVKMFALGIFKSRDKNEDNNDDQRRKRVRKGSADIDYADMPCTNAYLQSWWNRLDALVVLFALISLAAPRARFLRGLRAIRPIRIAIRLPQVRVVVKALIASISNVINAVCFSFFILFVLEIVGLQLFSGQFGRCVYEESMNAFDVVLDFPH